jgi:hypothetical protein
MDSEEHKAPEVGAVRESPETTAPSVPAPEAKSRSGFARMKARHRNLIDLHERLTADHERLKLAYGALKAGHDELHAAFDELLQIHNGLLSDLRQSHQVRSVAQSPLAGGGLSLMGQRHGR